VVLAEWLEEAFERRDRRRKAKARAEEFARGKAEVDRAWTAWLARLEEARALGEPFTEPTPSFADAVARVARPPMKIRYNLETDTLTIALRDDPVDHSREPVASVILDFDGGGEVIGIALLDVSEKTGGQVSVGLS
jgi:uncharacterized protein YuzE